MKILRHQPYGKPILLLLFISFIFIFSCSKDKEKESKSTGDIEFTFTNVEQGDSLPSPLPVRINGTIKNYGDIKKKDRLNLYLIEQSTRERIWHIEPKGKIDKNGDWTALTWLGNKRQGNNNTFNLCVFITDKPLRLNNGDHPVKKRPDSLSSSCIKVKRKD